MGVEGETMIRRSYGGETDCGYSRLLPALPFSLVPNDRPHARSDAEFVGEGWRMRLLDRPPPSFDGREGSATTSPSTASGSPPAASRS